MNSESPNDMFCEVTGEKCDGETTVAVSGTETPLAPISLTFAEGTKSKYGHSPMSAAFGTYDAIYTLKEAIERANSTSSDAVVVELEKTDRNCTRGRFKFTGNHDVFCNEMGTHWTNGYVRPLVVQWQTDAVYGDRLNVVSPKFEKATSFARKWSIPAWIDEIADTDLNGDGIVDIYDAILFSGKFGKKAGDSGFDMECDFDRNGIVNMADASELGKNFNKHRSYMRTSKLVTETTPLGFGVTETGSWMTMYLDPPVINGTQIGVNNSVTVNVNVSNALNIYSYQAGLTFNTSLLECVSVDASGDFFSGHSVWSPSINIDNDLGKVKPCGTTLTEIGGSLSGNGTLMQATFKVKAAGVSNIHLCDAEVISAGETSQMVPFDIIDKYTVTQYAPWTVSIVSNSTGVSTGYIFPLDSGNSDAESIGSGFSDHYFRLPEANLSFNVSGPLPGRLNATVPKTLLSVSYLDQLLVVVDGRPLRTYERTVVQDGDNYYVYFNYTERPHSVQILKRPPVYNDDANLYYSTIQEAINMANETSPPQTIRVFAGICNENVIANKTIWLVGESKYSTTIDGQAKGTVIRITAENVNVTGFTIRNSANYSCGILVDRNYSSIISHNIITGNYYGVLVNCSGSTTMIDNNMTGNKYNLGVYGENDADFSNDIDTTNIVNGKPVYYKTFDDHITYDLSYNIGALYLIRCDSITVKDLVLKNNTHGIFLYKTKNSRIENFTAMDNAVGIFLRNSNSNIIYHNSFITNAIHARAAESYYNTWNDNYPNGGNYWSDYSDIDFYRGPNQNEIGNDGIIDYKYTIDANNSDNYPLISPLAPSVYNIASNLGYTKIQDAINAAQTLSGHTIIVRNGTYNERLTVNKSVTLVGIDGSTIINTGGATAGVTITASNAVFRDFTLQGNSSTDKAVLVSFANNTAIRENVIDRGNWGIYLNRSYGCYIGGNIITNHSTDGISLDYSNNNNVSRNNLTASANGIHLIQSSGNTIRRNNILSNTQRGVFLYSSSNNKIYHNNFINNLAQYDVYSSSNVWDNGATSGGNYWSDYLTRYPSAKEIDDTGIGDTPYVIDSNNIDRYPLWSPRIPEHDMAVVSVTPSKTAVGQNFTVSIYITVENQGEYAEMFDLVLSNPSTGKTTALLPESIMLYTFVWSTSGPPMVPMGNYTISANVTHVPGETDTLDNNLTYGLITITYPGDFCLPGGLPDFKVGPADFAWLAKDFGQPKP
jgi:parallel beta-helix repeat protein